MSTYLKTALLLEERAASLPRESARRAHLLALAMASRQIGLQEMAVREKREAIDRLIEQGLRGDEAALLRKLASKFRRARFTLADAQAICGGKAELLCAALQDRGVLAAIIGEDATEYMIVGPWRWLA